MIVRTIHQCTPHKDEYKSWTEPGTLCHGANSNHGSDGEVMLVVRDMRRMNERRGSEWRIRKKVRVHFFI